MIRTPGRPHDSFSDDPLRMMRAARFAAQLGFTVRDDVVEAMTEQAERLSIVSAERIRVEFVKILMSPDPRRGLALLVDTGLAEYVLPELPLLRLEEDEHHHHKDVYEHTLTVLEQAIALEGAHEPMTGPDAVLRLAALLHDIGKPRTRRFEADGRVSFHHHEVVGARMTRKRMQALRFSNDMIDDVSTLVELHLRFHGYGAGEWTDSAVRRYVRDAGPLLTRLHKLTRADCTTRNRRRAAATLQRSYDSLEQQDRRTRGAGGARSPSGRISTAGRSCRSWASRRARSSARRTSSCSTCAWTAAHWTTSWRPRHCWPGGRPARSTDRRGTP